MLSSFFPFLSSEIEKDETHRTEPNQLDSTRLSFSFVVIFTSSGFILSDLLACLVLDGNVRFGLRAEGKSYLFND